MSTSLNNLIGIHSHLQFFRDLSSGISIKYSQRSGAGNVAKNNTSTLAIPVRRSVKVTLVEDQSKVSKSWLGLIDSFSELTCIDSCESAEEALAVIPKRLPDVVLMDIFLSGISGIECTARLKTLLPDLKIVMFTTMDDRKLVFRALEAGADGYLLKRTKPQDLRTALQEVLRGGVPMTSQIARCVVKSFCKHSQILDESKRLSFKEERILMLLCQGNMNKQIAAKLGISIHTVCEHLKRVFKKLEVSSRTEAVVRYMASKNPQQGAIPTKLLRNLASLSKSSCNRGCLENVEAKRNVHE